MASFKRLNHRLAIIGTHPIQYYAPFFRELSQVPGLIVEVFYTWGDESIASKYDPDFKRKIAWDIPLLEGYSYRFIINVARKKGSHHFFGIINPSLIHEIKDFNPSAILVYGWAFQSHLKVMRYFKGKVPILFRGDSTLLDDRNDIKKKVRRAVLSWIYRYVDYALCVGEENRKYFISNGIKADKIVFVPHAVDNERFRDHNAQLSEGPTDIKKNLGIPEGSFVFLFVGKLSSKKDPEILLKAFKELDAKESHLVFAGEGELSDQLRRSAGESTNIHFIGFQNQSVMPAIYKVADCLVLPSKGPGETWGLVINESLASGVPVISSDKAGAHSDLIVDGKTGYVFKHGNVHDLKHKMALMLQADREVMKEHINDLINSYSYHKGVEALKNLLLSFDQPVVTK